MNDNNTYIKTISLETPSNTAKWVALLSNGEVVEENSGNFIESINTKSSWLQLQSYIVQNNLKIQGLHIEKNGNIYRLPSINQQFDTLQPITYSYFRKIRADVYSTGGASIKDKYICIEAIYNFARIRLWVAENETNESFITLIQD